ncbi:MAG: two-component regulator propeller domain-containing protein [Saprospiraceae bacterium]
MNHILCLFKKLGLRKLGVIAAVFTLFHLSFLHAQNETFRSFTIEDGLPENTGNVLMQDTKGQLWIGTQAGVAIYDGVRFKNIGTEGEEGYSLTNNMIEGLYEDENGRVYIGTRKWDEYLLIRIPKKCKHHT